MKKDDPSSEKRPKQRAQRKGVSRRNLLKAGTGAAALGSLAGLSSADAQAVSSPIKEQSTPQPASRETPADHPYNVILFISDEEAYHLRDAEDYSTPAREELQRRGTTFHNHYIGSAMCTPSRGVMFSGQPPQVNGVFDQMELGYVPSLRTDKPSLGTIFKDLGYETAYFGKFELRKDIIAPKSTVNYTDTLREYGFDTFAPDGDKVGTPDQAYNTDTYTTGAAIRWLRTNAQEINRQGKPWCLIVSFVSPHDIMYAEVNQPGEKVQVSQVGMTILPSPENEHFAKQWKFSPSPSALEPMNSPGRPRAHLSYMIGWSAFVGEIPSHATQMWNTYYNFYLNLVRDNDRNLQSVLDAISALSLWETTVVMRTADHGELGGSHGGLRGKGPLPYEQEVHVPAVVVHPEHPGGGNCHALTSHVDLIPTLVGMTNTDQTKRSAAISDLPGHDFSSLLSSPGTAAVDAVREAALFNYVGLQTVDALYMMRVCRDIAEGRPAPPFSVARPDMSRRGFLSFVFDGRYKYSRYFAPNNFNTPETLDELLANNEIELFDLENDPDELENLGADPQKNSELIMRMNALLNRMIAKEVGTNDDRFFPASLRNG
ncbi:Choline-sulfatase [Pseudovibrio axinellae]|uniref:Choline-sulfatase n=1 Tax=Pseudovibrio axinellae TaxID=989403 RepID=A0A165W9V5_9HYPH|nr:sulfatase-like hydrolase/transferase [Pseudovibrio axinellae]KZL16263.1 Choline-sulfatase [Pseudovibrio axinellae]SER78339.1 arylsulfatase [Pseudovibrio axinellae]